MTIGTYKSLHNKIFILTLKLLNPQYKTNSNDRSCDQVLPISMIGSDYITFPSLPMNASVTDHYTIVAVYKDTKITVRLLL